jgi:hypothetical protein
VYLRDDSLAICLDGVDDLPVLQPTFSNLFF